MQSDSKTRGKTPSWSWSAPISAAVSIALWLGYGLLVSMSLRDGAHSAGAADLLRMGSTVAAGTAVVALVWHWKSMSSIVRNASAALTIIALVLQAFVV